jgi:acetoin utilization deacetylase AcuC-like enzyme
MLRFRLVYHDGYDLNFGAHVFPSVKYKLIRQQLLADQFAEAQDFIVPDPAEDEDLLLVHTPDWVNKLKFGTLTYHDILKLEVPYSRQMATAFWLAAGGTILAAHTSLEDGVGFNIGGGFHHAFPGYGEGFCAIHDVAVAIRKLQKEKRIEKALVADCDVHHGNGTAEIFASDHSVFTLSLHQFNNYPSEKPPSNLDIHLADGVGDAEYLARLRDAFSAAFLAFRPDMVMFIAGADPFHEDQLGGLSLTRDGLKARDHVVLDFALEHRTPVVVTLAGGYAMRVHDTVRIHCNTAVAAEEALRESGWKRSGS